ncbi:MAG: 4-hydroxybenzoate octaprenyltransferase [Acidobacteriota bacterium]|nr:4-hydroxybenzoate octaprenyltransferase [Acidobacteriota bacterium]
MFRRLRLYMSLVRFGHSVFALPFALVGALLAAEQHPVTLGRVAWIIAAMVTARTAAMAFNRLVDARFDALNPRTSNRELPRGTLKARDAALLVVVSSGAFCLVTTQLGLLCLILSPVALAIVFWYSLAKRFTAYTQLFLGLALAVAPMGGWLAAGGRGGWEPWLLAIGTGAWVAGFDIFYACQDLTFDRAQGLQSIPARFGVQMSLFIARCLHFVTVVALAAVVLVVPLGWWYLGGVAGVALLLTYEQSLVSPDDLSRVKEAFDLNGYVGLFYLTTTAGAIYVG